MKRWGLPWWTAYFYTTINNRTLIFQAAKNVWDRTSNITVVSLSNYTKAIIEPTIRALIQQRGRGKTRWSEWSSKYALERINCRHYGYQAMKKELPRTDAAFVLVQSHGTCELLFSSTIDMDAKAPCRYPPEPCFQLYYVHCDNIL